jgi:hypothetical protein
MRTLLCRFLACLAVALCACPPAPAQEEDPPPLILDGLTPAGVRISATEAWGTFAFTLVNKADFDRQARVVLSYEGQPDVQYGRDVWVPAHSTLLSWVLVGPAPAQKDAKGQDAAIGRELESLLYERRNGEYHLVLPPGESRRRTRGVPYRPRKVSTAIVLDPSFPDDNWTTADESTGRLPRAASRADEALEFAGLFRQALSLPDTVQILPPQALPVTAEAYDGIDHFIVASQRLARDTAGLLALRRWLERGGKVWVMLDLAEPEAVATLLGDAYDFQIVGRVGLTALTIEEHGAFGTLKRQPEQRHEKPVDLVRVLLPPTEQARHTVDGWPVWFFRKVGNGTVVLTTLSSRGWFRPRVKGDEMSSVKDNPEAPVLFRPLEELAFVMEPPREPPPLDVGAFKELLAGDIGYSVLSREMVLLVLGVALLAGLVVGVVLRRSPRRELLGWVGPVAAIGTAAVLFALGEATRRQAPPTLAVGQVIFAGTGREEVAVRGLLGVYRPGSGPAEIGVTRGGLFELDMGGLEGQIRRLLVTDMDAWHWENLDLPAGVRFASYRSTVPTGKTITAKARFGSEGLEGELTTGVVSGLGDAVLSPPGGRNLSVRLGPDGSFRVGSQDALPAQQFLASTVLSERQRRRQELYRAFLRPTGERRLRDGNYLLAWGEPFDTGFALGPQDRQAGDALLVVPLRLERPAPGMRITIPGQLVPYQRVVQTLLSKELAAAKMSSTEAADQQLRFQLPPEVLPFQVERARLTAKVSALARRVVVAGHAENSSVELFQAESPLTPFQVELIDARLLRLDPRGGLHLTLNVSDPVQGGERKPGETHRQPEPWTIEYVELEVVGRTHADKEPR